MRNFFAATFVMLMISSTCAAMMLHVAHKPLQINFYEDSCQIGDNTLKPADVVKIAPDFYLHYDTAKNFSNFGDRDVRNTVAVDLRGMNELTIVEDYDGTAFYLIKNNTPPGDAIKVLGKRDGKWVVMLNVTDLREKYNLGWNFFCTKFIAHGDKIIFRYELNADIVDIVCTWDAANQTFSTKAIER